MKVKLTRDYVGRKKGEVLDLNNATAEKWVARGDATEVKSSSAAKKSAPKGDA